MGEALPRLCQGNLDRILPGSAAIPVYPRQGIPPGVVHLGLGAFNRAHQGLVFDELLASGDLRWGVLGVATRSWTLADTLAKQDGLYAVKLADAAGSSWYVAGAILQTCAAMLEPARVHAAIASQATRWLTLTVTEKGYDSSLASLLVEGLGQRAAAGHGGLTIASCDNLSHNGDKLRKLCLEHCIDASLSAWIVRECRFPNSMVDRIVPAATAACAHEAAATLGVQDAATLSTETFWQWVIEDKFVGADDARVLSAAGVTVVSDVGPYEDAKLRMLNGSHSALACLGVLMGLPTVFDAVSHSAIRLFLFQLMTAEVIPNLSRPDLPAYRDALLQRFANPEVRHGVHQIASDSSKKIGLRWVPSITAQLQSGGPIHHHAFAAAAWMRYCSGRDDQGLPYAINDPQAALMQGIVQSHRTDVEKTVATYMQVESIWGPSLAGNARWESAVALWLHAINSEGVGPALQILVDESEDR
jgi:fructuronate reductase